jgi:hypothetical protein
MRPQAFRIVAFASRKTGATWAAHALNLG